MWLPTPGAMQPVMAAAALHASALADVFELGAAAALRAAEQRSLRRRRLQGAAMAAAARPTVSHSRRLHHAVRSTPTTVAVPA